jgi:hypothetical protein
MGGVAVSIDSIFNYINHWYGIRRLQQVMSTDIVRKVRDTPEVTVDASSSMSSSGSPVIRQRVTYEHPYLGLNLDMLI